MIKREKFLFKSPSELPQYWKVYFSMSEVGREYEILWDQQDPSGKGENLIMSNTEYEIYTNEPFFSEIKQGDEILSIGYGIGLINPYVKSLGAKLTVVEKYASVIELEDNLDSNIDIIIGDINTMDLHAAFGEKRFDIIFTDTFEKNTKSSELAELLKSNGKFIEWKHLVPKKNWRPRFSLNSSNI